MAVLHTYFILVSLFCMFVPMVCAGEFNSPAQTIVFWPGDMVYGVLPYRMENPYLRGGRRSVARALGLFPPQAFLTLPSTARRLWSTFSILRFLLSLR